MRELSILEGQSSRTAKPSFWRRQFAPEATRSQLTFDLAFGVIGPLLCFVFDPIVFRGGLAGPPLFPDYQLFVYFLSGLEVMVLCLWLLSGAAFRAWNVLIGGALMIGGIFCVGVGLVLLPFSAVGLMMGIGLFGFTPFLTAIVYLRNGFRAWHFGGQDATKVLRAASLLFGLVLVLGAPALLATGIHNFVASAIDEMIKGDSRHALAAAQGLGPLKYFVAGESDRIVQAYLAESDQARKQILKICYQEITGEDIEFRVRVIQD